MLTEPNFQVRIWPGAQGPSWLRKVIARIGTQIVRQRHRITPTPWRRDQDKLSGIGARAREWTRLTPTAGIFLADLILRHDYVPPALAKFTDFWTIPLRKPGC